MRIRNLVSLITVVIFATLMFTSNTVTATENVELENKVSIVKAVVSNDLESHNPNAIVDNMVESGKVEAENSASLKESFKGIVKAKSNDERALHTVNALETTGVMSSEKAENMRMENKGPGETAFLWNFFGYLGAFAAIILVSALLSA